jgi:hypothetical protein
MHRGFHRLETRMDDVLRHLEQNQTGSAPGLCLVTEHTDPTRQSTPVSNDENAWSPTRDLSLSEITNPLVNKRRTLEIDGERLTFDISAVPNPPTVSFADNVELLLGEWYSSSRLVVAGHGIPIRHWDKFYMKKHKIKPHAWDSLRSTWHNWKVRTSRKRPT